MAPILFALAPLQFIFGSLLFLTSLFLILLVLVQRGRGGGLSGALGGAGGQSAFGTKAGDVFTRVTVVAAICWILLCMASIALLNSRDTIEDTGGTSTPTMSGVGDQQKEDAGDASGGAAATDGADSGAAESGSSEAADKTP